jgi:hypothetical protein
VIKLTKSGRVALCFISDYVILSLQINGDQCQCVNLTDAVLWGSDRGMSGLNWTYAVLWGSGRGMSGLNWTYAILWGSGRGISGLNWTYAVLWGSDRGISGPNSSLYRHFLHVCLFVFGATTPSGPWSTHSRGF